MKNITKFALLAALASTAMAANAAETETTVPMPHHGFAPFAMPTSAPFMPAQHQAMIADHQKMIAEQHKEITEMQARSFQRMIADQQDFFKQMAEDQTRLARDISYERFPLVEPFGVSDTDPRSRHEEIRKQIAAQRKAMQGRRDEMRKQFEERRKVALR